jgi:hypothetical protein
MVAVSAIHVHQLVYVFVSALSPTLWYRAVPMQTFFFLIVRDHSPSPVPVLFIFTIASVTPYRDLLSVARPTTGYNCPYRPYSLYPRDCWPLATPLQRSRAWSSPFKAQGIGARHRHPCTCTATSVRLFVRVLQPFSNHYPEPARSSFIAWRTTTALYDRVSIRLLRRYVHGYQLGVCFIRERVHRGLEGSPLQTTRG